MLQVDCTVKHGKNRLDCAEGLFMKGKGCQGIGSEVLNYA
jgi:hypothetical protein